jgi:hypothetical protein
MPAKSQAQRGYLYATKGESWVKEHHFDNKGKLPAHKAKAEANAKKNLKKAFE